MCIVLEGKLLACQVLSVSEKHFLNVTCLLFIILLWYEVLQTQTSGQFIVCLVEIILSSARQTCTPFHIQNQPMHPFIINSTLLVLCHSDMFQPSKGHLQ